MKFFPAAPSGLLRRGEAHRVALRFTRGYDPAPLRGLTALSVTTLGPGAAERSGSSNRSLTVAARALSVNGVPASPNTLHLTILMHFSIF